MLRRFFESKGRDAFFEIGTGCENDLYLAYFGRGEGFFGCGALAAEVEAKGAQLAKGNYVAVGQVLGDELNKVVQYVADVAIIERRDVRDVFADLFYGGFVAWSR